MSKLLKQYTYTNDKQETEIIDDAQTISVNLGSEIKNDELRLKVKNAPINVFSDGTIRHRWVGADGIIKFNAVKAQGGTVIDEELIEIYTKYTDTNPNEEFVNPNNFLFGGFINKGKVKYNDGENSIELFCLNRSAVILDRLSIPQNFNIGDAKPSPEIVKELVRNGVDNVQSNQRGFDSNGVLKTDGTGQFLIDARLFSESIVDSGTTTSASDNKLIESGQNFESTVDIGDWVRNTATNQYAYVVSVDSDTQLTLTKDIMTSGAGYQVSDGFIQDLRPNGTAFPVMSFTQPQKPINENVKTLSQIDKTNNSTETDPNTGVLIVKRSMRWFLDMQNRLHWYVPDNTPEFIMRVGQTSAISPDTSQHLIQSVDLDKEVIGNVNFIIYYAGEDMNNNMVDGFARAPFSGSPNAKDAMRRWLHIARDMKKQEEDAGNIVHTGGTEYNFPVSYNPLPSGSGTPTWDETGSTPLTDNDYNTAFITEANRRATVRSQSVFAKLSNPRWAGKITIRGEHILVGDLIKFTSVAHGIKDIKIRVNQVNHSISSRGWITQITAEEDELESQIS